MAKKKKKEKSEDHLKTYAHHGVDFSPGSKGEMVGECPFCGENNLYINEEKGLFSCKNADCSEGGNKYTFLEKWYELCLSQTKAVHVKKLAANRKLPKECFTDADLAWDKLNSRWIIPVRNAKGSLSNLRIWDAESNIIQQTAGCNSHLYGADTLGLDASVHTVYVCEGEWDCIAMQWLLSKSKNEGVAVVACPGAGTFKEEWLELFDKKDVRLVYDNDEAGQKGMSRTAKMLGDRKECKSLAVIEWPDSYPEKFDVRDYVIKHLKKPKLGLKRLNGFFSKPSGVTTKYHKEECKSFTSLCTKMSKHIYLSEDMKNALLIIMSTIFSNKIFDNPYCPLWIFIVGPPGSGKTLLLQSTSELDDAYWITTLGSKTLVSGWLGDGQDNSLLPKLIGKTAVIEDFTGIMSQSASEQEELYGVLRSVYNGRYEKSFGHTGLRVYPAPNSGHETCHFSLVAGATGVIHADKRANKGERFIKFHMKSKGYNPLDQIKAAINNTVKEEPPEHKIRAPVNGFVEYKMAQPAYEPKVEKWLSDRIIGLGQIVSMIRAVVVRQHGELVVRPEPEVATRISQQLIKLGKAMAFTLGKKTVDKSCYALLAKVALDTCYGFHLDVFLCVLAHQKTGIVKLDISKKTSIAKTTVGRVLDDLMELGVTTFDLIKSTGAGQPPQLWKLTKDIFDIVEYAQLRKVKYTKQLLDEVSVKEPPKKVANPNAKNKRRTTKKRSRKS